MDTNTENPRSIKAMAAAGVTKLRKTVWANQKDHLLITIVDGKPAVWSHLFCPMNKALSGRDPLPMCDIEMDLEAAEWLPYTGPDATSAEYLAEQERCTILMSSSGTLHEESTATEGKIADVYAGRYKPMMDAPKDGTAILALLEGSDIPLPIRWRVQGDTMAKRGPGWYVTWDGNASQPASRSRGWLPIPTEWLPEAEPIGYISPKQVSAIRDADGEFGHYHPMRKTRAGLFTLAVYTEPVTGLYSGMSPLEQRAAQAAPTARPAAQAWTPNSPSDPSICNERSAQACGPVYCGDSGGYCSECPKRKAATTQAPPCKGKNCGCTDGVSHSLECHAEHAAAIAGGTFVQDAQPAQQCACKDRPADQCPGEWEPGCDLGANPAYVRVAQQQPQPSAREENDCEDQGMSNVSEGCNKWPCDKEPLIKAGNGWICTKCGGSY